MHPLRRYLRELDESVSDFGARVGACRQTLYRIMRGVQRPKPALARRIVEATGGAVSLEALYGGRAAKGVPPPANGRETPYDGGPSLDRERLRVALAVVVHNVSPPDGPAPPEEAMAMAAEAAANTYIALSNVTTREGPARLRQTLRLVLEEILREYSGPPPPSVLDRGATLATEVYHQTWLFDSTDRSAL